GRLVMTEILRGGTISSLVRADGRDEPLRLDREDGTIDPLQDGLRRVADQEAADAGAGDGPHDDEVDPPGLRELRDHLRRVAVEQVHGAASGPVGGLRKETVEGLPGFGP